MGSQIKERGSIRRWAPRGARNLWACFVYLALGTVLCVEDPRVSAPQDGLQESVSIGGPEGGRDTSGPPAKCEELGFTGLALCSDCDSFAEYVDDKGLEAECRQCCVEEAEDSLSKATFSSAVLEVCQRKLMFFSSIQHFIREKAPQFPALQVRYVGGSPPKLLMRDSKGKTVETVRIDNWKMESINDFLSEKLRPGGAS